MSWVSIFLFTVLLVAIINVALYFIRQQNARTVVSIIASGLVLAAGSWLLDINLEDMGFAEPLKGLAIGVVASVTVLAIIWIGSRLSITKGFFSDDRTAFASLKEVRKKTLIDIPLGTVIFEEVLFRGVVLGYLLVHTDQTTALLLASALFGLWHILPSFEFFRTNKNNSSKSSTIIGTVLFTFVAGALFGLLRIWSGSILAPMLLHYSVNSGSFLASWYVSREK